MRDNRVTNKEIDRRMDNILKSMGELSKERIADGVHKALEIMLKDSTSYFSAAEVVTVMDSCLWPVNSKCDLADKWMAERKQKLQAEEDFKAQQAFNLTDPTVSNLIEEFTSTDDMFNKLNAFFNVFNYAPTGNVEDVMASIKTTLLTATVQELDNLYQEYIMSN